MRCRLFPEEKDFGFETVENGLRSDTRDLEEISRDQLGCSDVSEEGMDGIAPGFLNWEGVYEEFKRMERFFHNLTDLTGWWEEKPFTTGSVGKKKPSEYAMQAEEGYRLNYFDVFGLSPLLLESFHSQFLLVPLGGKII